MTSKQKHLSVAKNMVDSAMVKSMYMIRHSDAEGLAILSGMRADLRDALNAIECHENPTIARTRRIAAELKLTGNEQQLPL